MRVSIIIPAHNEAQHLEACLSSFVAQTDPPNALLVVDDNSTDGTFQIASSFAAAHDWINVVQRQSTDMHMPG